MNNSKAKSRHPATDLIFRIGLIVKAIDSALEVVGGILLMMPGKLSRYILVFSQHEAFRHHEALAGRLDNLSQVIAVRTSMVDAIYLCAHGLAKVVFIAAMVCGKKWGYTCLMVVMSIFSLIEITRAITAREVLTACFGLFDLGLVAVIYKEFRIRFSASGPADVSPS